MTRKSGSLFSAFAFAAILAVTQNSNAQPIPAAATQHRTVALSSGSVPYTFEVAEVPVTGRSGALIASFGTFTYLLDTAEPAKRPVVFLFGGGPGGTSTSLREGFAPRAPIPVRTEGTLAFPDNPDSLIDVADLVFVDTPGTGYARLFDESAAREVWGTQADADLAATFVANWLHVHHREMSPKYVVGHSYGGLRVPFVARALAHAAKPIELAGIVMISPSTGTNNTGFDPAVGALPGMATTAWSYGKGAYTKRTLAEVSDAARVFANGRYAAALKSANLPADEEQAIVAALANFTALPESYIREKKLRLSSNDLITQLLKDQGERLGLNDGRVHAAKAEMDKRPPPTNDPSVTLAFNDDPSLEEAFLADSGYKAASRYVMLGMRVNQSWNRKVEGEGNGPEIVKTLMTQQPRLRALVLVGYFDLNVPYSGVINSFEAAHLPTRRWSYDLLPGGHSMFDDPIARPLSAAKIRAFILGH